ncbi:hypothetical protein OQA88_10528 [Cercophora sp. LCS_1]
MNFNITVPEGTTNHGNPQLLCTPARWYDFIVFFLTNYIAHAATVVPIPGQDIEASIFHIVLALCLPASAVVRSVGIIARRAATEKDPLRRARRAGALCIVLKKPSSGPIAKMLRSRFNRRFGPLRVREDPEGGSGVSPTDRRDTNDEVTNVQAEGTSELKITVDDTKSATGDAESAPQELSGPWWDPPEGYMPAPEATQVHGEYWLHDDYYLALVPPVGVPDLELDHGSFNQQNLDPKINHSAVLLSSSHNLLKLVISLLQSMWAVITIYRARGDQIQQYGYAAFGLTVAPYATMSIVNTIANMLTPEYATTFVLRTPLLEELEAKGIVFFNGALDVKEKQTLDEEQPKSWKTKLVDFTDALFFDQTKSYTVEYPSDSIYVVGFIVSVIPLAIIGGLSRFRNEQSTQMQRGFTMAWLVVGIVYGLFLSDPRMAQAVAGDNSPLNKRNNGVYAATVNFLVFATPVVGGMVMVGEMIRDFGICTLLAG